MAGQVLQLYNTKPFNSSVAKTRPLKENCRSYRLTPLRVIREKFEFDLCALGVSVCAFFLNVYLE